MDYNIPASIQYLIVTIILLGIIVTLVYLYAEKINKWAIIDIFWGLGFVFTAILGWGVYSNFAFNLKLMPVIFITLWGIRLSLYLGKRVIRMETDDQRYIDLKNSGMSKIRNYLQVFGLQALFMWLMCLPLYFYMTLPIKIAYDNMAFSILGALVCIWGLAWEWTADHQMSLFKKPGQLVKEGLWKLTRHPNYFGEICFWTGIWFMTRTILFSNMGASILIAVITSLSPALIFVILNYITGPMLERNMEHYPEWVEYKSNTPYILPVLKNNK